MLELEALQLLPRFLEQLLARSSGPLSLRFLIQPTVACILAIRAGRRDARRGEPPFFWAILSGRADRRRLLRSGWQDIGKLLTGALILDLGYQLVMFRWFYPLETIVIVLLLAALPYVLVRSLVNRLSRPPVAIRTS